MESSNPKIFANALAQLTEKIFTCFIDVDKDGFRGNDSSILWMLAPPVTPEAIFSNIIIGYYWIEYFQYKVP